MAPVEDGGLAGLEGDDGGGFGGGVGAAIADDVVGGYVVDGLGKSGLGILGERG